MKRVASLLIIIFVFSQSAFARDSTWLSCRNNYFVINVLEHRNNTGDGRETALKLLYGMHSLDGILIEDNSASVNLLELPETEETENGPVVYTNSFVGSVKINYSTSLSLKGVLNLYGFNHPIDTKLVCNEMDADLLPQEK
jgi:hypothetical protein